MQIIMSYPKLPSFQSTTPYVHRPNKLTGDEKKKKTVSNHLHTSSWNKHLHIAECRWTVALIGIKIFHSARHTAVDEGEHGLFHILLPQYIIIH